MGVSFGGKKQEIDKIDKRRISTKKQKQRLQHKNLYLIGFGTLDNQNNTQENLEWTNINKANEVKRVMHIIFIFYSMYIV